MNRDDDFPATQQAPPPPPEPPPAPAGRDPRAITHTANVYESVEQLLPAHTWKENPLIWIALVVAMFMAVPLLASLAGRDTPAKPPKPRAEAPASQPADAAPAQAEAVPVVAPAPTPARAMATPTPGNVSELPPNLRPQTDASRQMITKCYENGRVVYTQTGACTGSMTAVPIDTGKNVLGPGGGAPAAPGGSR
jgi:hypothetical protein